MSASAPFHLPPRLIGKLRTIIHDDILAMRLAPLPLVALCLVLLLPQASDRVEAQVLPNAATDAAQAAADPCRNGALVEIQQRLGYLDSQEQPIVTSQVACKRLPYEPSAAVIALFQLQPGSDPVLAARGEGTYDLHLIIADKRGSILAQMRDVGAAQSDAVRLDAVGIDTGIYRLAPGVRAFGVTTYNATHCYHCAFDETSLSLFVWQGTHLKKVLTGLIQSTTISEDDETVDCTSQTSTARKLIAIGPRRQAGYADLVITTLTTHSPGVHQEDGEDCSGGAPQERRSETWRYDGNEYRPASDSSTGTTAINSR